MDSSPLTRLPPEIRSQIYELVLQCGGVHICLQDIESPWEFDPKTMSKDQLALTQVCKALRRETDGTFFTVNTFTLSASIIDHLWPLWCSFATSIGARNVEALRLVKLEASFVYCGCYELDDSNFLCSDCEGALACLGELHNLILAHPKLSIEVDEHYAETSSPGVELRYTIPLNVENISAGNRNDEIYLFRYRNAYKAGIRREFWPAFETLTGLKKPEKVQKSFITFDAGNVTVCWCHGLR